MNAEVFLMIFFAWNALISIDENIQIVFHRKRHQHAQALESLHYTFLVTFMCQIATIHCM